MSAWQHASRYELARVYVALLLSPKVGLAELLLAGEAVPVSRLHPWVKRFAKQENLPARVTLDDFHLVPS